MPTGGPNPDRDKEKELAARAAVTLVKDGDIVGLGSGTTSTHAIRLLGERVRQGLSIRGVPSSKSTEQLASGLGIPLTSLDEVQELDIAIDGADEVDPNLCLIKGGGGAMLREKVVASASRRFVVMVDSSKQVPVLGKFPLPVEVIPFAEHWLAAKITGLGAKIRLRQYAYGNPYITDEGHHILDCEFGDIPNPAKLARELESLPGVVEHGLFVGIASLVLVGIGEGVRELKAKAS